MSSSQLKGRYLVRNPLATTCLSFLDFFLRFFPKRNATLVEPKKILLSNGGHLGDVVIATALLPLLKKAFPKAKIGFVVASWSKCVLKDHPLVDHLHLVDHWKISRKKISLLKKIWIYIKTRKRALQEIEELRYDIAIDLYSFFPNNIFLFWQARIPMRIGYSSGGFGPLLTHGLEWCDRKTYIAEEHFELFKFLKVEKEKISRPNLIRETSNLDLPEGYIVFHPSSGSSLKDWREEKWQELLEKTLLLGREVVFTGKGIEDFERAQRVIGSTKAINLCDKLNFKEFLKVISEAKAVVTVDTLTSHVAFAYDIPTIILFSGIADIARWTPPGEKIYTLFSRCPFLPCCHQKECKKRICIENIGVEEVLDKIRALLS